MDKYILYEASVSTGRRFSWRKRVYLVILKTENGVKPHRITDSNMIKEQYKKSYPMKDGSDSYRQTKDDYYELIKKLNKVLEVREEVLKKKGWIS
jgi:hypothetical protein